MTVARHTTDLAYATFVRAGEAMVALQVCSRCAHRQYPADWSCGRCGHDDWARVWVYVEGDVVARTQVRRPLPPEDSAPYWVALVRIADGIHVPARLLEHDENAGAAVPASVGAHVIGIPSPLVDHPPVLFVRAAPIGAWDR